MTYDYRVARVVRVVDGDTVDLTVDLGFYMTAAIRFRLLGVNAPERGKPGWAEASAFVTDWLATAGPLRVRTVKADSFGRWLADIYSTDRVADLNADLRGYLVTSGWSS